MRAAHHLQTRPIQFLWERLQLFPVVIDLPYWTVLVVQRTSKVQCSTMPGHMQLTYPHTLLSAAPAEATRTPVCSGSDNGNGSVIDDPPKWQLWANPLCAVLATAWMTRGGFSCYVGQYICADQNGSIFQAQVSFRVDFKSLRYPKGSKYMNFHLLISI